MRWIRNVLISLVTLLLTTCGSKTPSLGDVSEVTSSTYIYVASGTTYAGQGVTVGTPTNTVVKYNEDGTFNSIVEDFTSYPGDSPVALLNYDDTHLLVLVENTGARRLEKLAKDGSGRTTFILNTTALASQVRAVAQASDGGYLISDSGSIEKFNTSKARVVNGGNAYVQGPGGSCATSATLIPSLVVGPGGSIFFAHAAASPNNQINVISVNGYTTAGDCLAAIDGPSATHYPTAMLLHSNGHLYVGYGNSTGPINQVYSYDITSTSISNATLVGNDPNYLSGVSAFAEMSDGTLLVANSGSTFNTIERFTVGASALTRVGTSAFIGPSIYTKSISGIVISN